MNRTISFLISSALLLVAAATISAGSDYEPGLDGNPTFSSAGFPPSEDFTEPTGTLSLSDAVSLALRRNPGLAASAWDVRAEEAQVLQSGLWPNPEFDFEAEGFGGNRDLRGTDSVETTYQLSQSIELGSKRSRRISVASLRRDRADWEYRTARLQVIAETHRRFTQLLAAKEHLRLQDDLVAMATQTLDVVREQVRAGKVSPVDETRARAELSRTRIERERLASEWKVARLRMSAMWASSQPVFEDVAGDLFSTRPVPPLADLIARLPGAPHLARWETELKARQETVGLEKARAVPDLLLSGGVRHENASDSTGFVLAVSVPIPLFDRNTGAIRRAQYRASQLRDARLAAEIEARVALEAAYESALAARAESVALRDEALPAAEAASLAAEEAYRFGKLGYLDVLESRKSLTEVRSEYLEVLVDYHAAVTEIERLIGGPLSSDYTDTEQNTKEDKNE